MRKTINWIFLLILLTGCGEINIQNDQKLNKLTPYITSEQSVFDAELKTQVPERTLISVQTATPKIHIVELGETISSISLIYGLSMDGIMAANPEANPNALIVGDELVIPASNSSETVAVDQKLLENFNITHQNCIKTRDSGLWCAVDVENRGEETVQNIAITFTFWGPDGEMVGEWTAPGLMQFIEPGMSIPAAVFINKIPEEYMDTTAGVVHAQIIDDEVPLLTVELEEENHKLNGKTAEITGLMNVSADESKERADISIGAAAFDVDGRIVGIRRLDSSVTTNEHFNFVIRVYANTGSIEKTELFVEAY